MSPELTIYNAYRYIAICRREHALMAGIGHPLDEKPNDPSMRNGVKGPHKGARAGVSSLLCKPCLKSFVDAFSANIINTDDPNIKP